MAAAKANAIRTVREPLYIKVHRSILQEIESGTIVSDGKLITEGEMVERYGVSRATIRSALQMLESEGIITTRHGIGSFVNYVSAAGMRMRIDIAKGFFHLIMDSGHIPSIHKATLRKITLPERICQSLLIPEESEGIMLRRTFLGDGMPVFLSIEYIPLSSLSVVPTSPNLPESIYQIGEQYFKAPIDYSQTYISSFCIDEETAYSMSLKKGDAVLRLKEVHYSHSNEPLAFSDVYVNDRIIHFQVRRTRAGL